MALIATYNSQAFNDPQSWTVNRTSIKTFDGQRDKKVEIVCSVVGQFLGNTTASARATDLATLQTKIDEPNQDFTITQDGTTIFSLTASNVIEGPFASFSIPGDTPFKSGYDVPFVLTVRAMVDIQGATTILARSDETTWSSDNKSLLTRTVRGEIKVASGHSAAAQLATVTPATIANYERSYSYSTSADDLEMSYQFVDAEQSDSNPGGATGGSWSVSASSANGEEVWVMSGTLEWPKSKRPNESTVDSLYQKLVKGKVKVVSRSVERNPKENSLSFTIRGVRAYGKDKTLSYRRTITVQQQNSTRIYKALDSEGADLRQEWGRPTVTVSESGSMRTEGGYGTFPELLLDGSTLDQKSDTVGNLEIGPDGEIAFGEITFSRRYIVLNEVDQGALAEFSQIAGTSEKEIADLHPAKGKKHNGKVA